MQDLLDLLNCHFPNTFATSKFLILKYFKIFDNQLEKHFYCQECSNYIGVIDESVACGHCNSAKCPKENIKKGCNFIYIPIKNQLELLLSDPTISSYVANIDESYGILSGCQYRAKVHENDLNILWNSDGVPVFRSNNCSIWPLQFVLNELPHKLQRNNVHIVDYGLVHPNHEWTHS